MNGGRLFRSSRLTLSCNAEGKEGRKGISFIISYKLYFFVSFKRFYLPTF
jgi:hypothetical protein